MYMSMHEIGYKWIKKQVLDLVKQLIITKLNCLIELKPFFFGTEAKFKTRINL